MKDLRIEVRFKNGLLHDAITRRFGERWSVRGVAADLGVPYFGLLELLSLRRGPAVWVDRKKKTTLNWSSAAMAISLALGEKPEDLFPRDLYELRLPARPAIMVDSHILPLAEISAADNLCEPIADLEGAMDRQESVVRALRSLPRRQERVIRARFGLDGEGERTLQEVAEMLGVGRERVRQIEAKALRNLRHPKRWGPREPEDRMAHLIDDETGEPFEEGV